MNNPEGFDNSLNQENIEGKRWNFVCTNIDVPGRPIIFEGTISAPTEVEVRQEIAHLFEERFKRKLDESSHIGITIIAI